MSQSIAVALIASLFTFGLGFLAVNNLATVNRTFKLQTTGFESVAGPLQVPVADSDAETAEDREPLYLTDEQKRNKWARVLTAASEQLPSVLARHLRQPTINLDADTSGNDKDVHTHESDEVTHWSFKRLQHVSPPTVADASSARNPIDLFLSKRLAEEGLSLNDEATPHELRRRLSFDLRGLPPEFDEDVPSYDELIEVYLDDEAFGERWARTWLDVARYADSNGYEIDELRPDAYPYRDFVIWAMNNDLPFDRFVQWQIAGDELAPQLPPAVAATGFLTAGTYNTFMPQESERRDELNDIVATMGNAMLGLSIGCARCHDHFYDPISSREYYQLIAVFEETQRTHKYLTPDGGNAYEQMSAPLVEREAEVDKIQIETIREGKIAALDFTEEEKDILRLPLDPTNEKQTELAGRCGGCLRVEAKDYPEEFTPLPKLEARYEQLLEEITALKKKLPYAPMKGLVITGSTTTETSVLEGGSLKRQGDRVGPGFLDVLTPRISGWDGDQWKHWYQPQRVSQLAKITDQMRALHTLPWNESFVRPLPESQANQRSVLVKPRTALAFWLTDVEDGAGSLLARVIVNRLWQHHFGEGLVSTSDDLGTQGETPTHPELLDWLANELIGHGWSLKHIHRLIVSSAAYRQSSFADDERLAADPQNKLLSRFPRRRLTAEMVRDTMLSVSGNLNREMYGPGIFPPIPADAIYTDNHEKDAKWPTDTVEGPDVWRRSVYVTLRRSNTVPLLDLFDACDGGLCRGKRNVTTVPIQALALLNSPFVRGQSRSLAERLADEADMIDVQVDWMFRYALGRDADMDELDAVYETIERRRLESPDVEDIDLITDLCQVILMSNEFLYLD